MGQTKVKLPTTPQGWAIHLSKIVRLVHDAHGMDRFPIDVATIARDFSRNVYPDAPITLVEGQRFSGKFEGALMPRPDGSGEWGIFYNEAITSRGRINYTLAHELGHYLLHRQRSGDPIFCASRDMWAWDSAYGRMEAEANEFASFLLMPLDDFRQQIDGMTKPTVSDFAGLRDRYGVSLTAAILKWLEITPMRAMIVVSRDGFIDWSWSSKPLLRSGVFFKPRQQVTELPEGSLARAGQETAEALAGTTLPSGVWSSGEEVFESVLFSEYHGMAISLLIYSKHAPRRFSWQAEIDDEPGSDEVLDRFSGSGAR